MVGQYCDFCRFCKTARNMGMKGRLVCGAVSACAASSCARVRGCGGRHFLVGALLSFPFLTFFVEKVAMLWCCIRSSHPAIPIFLLPDLCEKKKNMGKKKTTRHFFRIFWYWDLTRLLCRGKQNWGVLAIWWTKRPCKGYAHLIGGGQNRVCCATCMSCNKIVPSLRLSSWMRLTPTFHTTP